MKVQYVTLTGADDTIDPKDLAALSEKYPFVEWAILFSQSKAGVARYPSLEWVDRLFDAKTSKMNLSAHLCGKWVEDALNGQFGLFQDQRFSQAFQRVQLNMGASRLVDAFGSHKLSDGLWQIKDKKLIFGGNYQQVMSKLGVDFLDGFFDEELAIYPLFDASGGRGIKSNGWPDRFTNSFGYTPMTGYAGGLGPDNVAQELQAIEYINDPVHADDPIWIDMETKLRNKADKFDLTICEEVLKAVEPWAG